MHLAHLWLWQWLPSLSAVTLEWFFVSEDVCDGLGFQLMLNYQRLVFLSAVCAQSCSPCLTSERSLSLCEGPSMISLRGIHKTDKRLMLQIVLWANPNFKLARDTREAGLQLIQPWHHEEKHTSLRWRGQKLSHSSDNFSPPASFPCTSQSMIHRWCNVFEVEQKWLTLAKQTKHFVERRMWCVWSWYWGLSTSIMVLRNLLNENLQINTVSIFACIITA